MGIYIVVCMYACINENINGNIMPLVLNKYHSNPIAGDWVDDNMEGIGTMRYASGNKYEGQWKGGSITGKGSFHYANKDTYEGL